MMAENGWVYNWNRQQWATAIAIAFHVSGFIAMGLFKSNTFVMLTPLNLLVCAALIFWTHEHITPAFVVFVALAFSIGFFAEWTGINTGMLFGDYTYGAVLGPAWQGVPFIIGIQWMVVVYCAGVSMAMLHQRLLMRAQTEGVSQVPAFLITLSLVADGALIAMVFDWIMEPVAIHLKYWQWKDNVIPWFNYACWWAVSAIALFCFHILPFRKHNLFAVHLLMIQTMFFLLMRAVI